MHRWHILFVGLVLLFANMSPGLADVLPMSRVPIIRVVENVEPLEISKDAELHAVGVYEGDEGTAPAIHGPVVNIAVNRPGKKVALILTSYSPVRWTITRGAGTAITEIYFSSFEREPFSEVLVNGKAFANARAAKIAYVYQDKGRNFRKLLATAQESMGRSKLDSFHGVYRPDPSGFVIDAVSQDTELKNDRLVVTRADRLPRLIFRADLVEAGVYDLSGKLVKKLPGALVKSAYVPSKDEFYAIGRNGLRRYDAAGEELETIPVTLDVPLFSWPTDITYNPRLNQIVVSSLGGEGFLYRYNLETKKWSAASFDQRDYNSFQYDDFTDHYIATGGWENGKIYEIGENGEVIQRIDIDLMNTPGFTDTFDLGNGRITFSVIPRKEYLIIIVSKRIYLYNRKTKAMQLTYAGQ